MQSRHLPLLLALTVVGCAPAAPVAPAPQAPAVAERTVTATGYLTPRGFDGHLLALVNAWSVADIDHVVLTISVGGSTVGTLTIPHANLSNQVTINNLKLNTSYSILAQAYNTSNASAPIDNSAVLLSSCTTPFSTTNDSSASIGPIALQLVNKTFAGAGGNDLNISLGTVVDTGTALSLGVTSYITTFAGTGGTAGFSGDGGAAASATISSPYGVAVDGSGNLYIADYGNNRIRKVTPAGIISTIAGTGTASFSGDTGLATSATFNAPEGVGIDLSGNVLVVDENNNRIRMVCQTTGTYYGVAMTAGKIYTVAGNASAGFSGDNGAATSASLNNPYAVSVDGSGNLYIADATNARIRKVTPAGIISTFAGTGSTTYNGDGIAATSASLAASYGVAADVNGNVYIADTYHNRIRLVDHTTGLISTVAGTGTNSFSGDGAPATGATLNLPYGIVLDPNGGYYIGDQVNNRIRKVSAGGTISTVAGVGTAGFSGDNGAALSAQLSGPAGIALDPTGHLFIADRGNHCIRKLL